MCLRAFSCEPKCLPIFLQRRLLVVSLLPQFWWAPPCRRHATTVQHGYGARWAAVATAAAATRTRELCLSKSGSESNGCVASRCSNSFSIHPCLSVSAADRYLSVQLSSVLSSLPLCPGDDACSLSPLPLPPREGDTVTTTTTTAKGQSSGRSNYSSVRPSLSLCIFFIPCGCYSPTVVLCTPRVSANVARRDRAALCLTGVRSVSCCRRCLFLILFRVLQFNSNLFYGANNSGGRISSYLSLCLLLYLYACLFGTAVTTSASPLLLLAPMHIIVLHASPNTRTH